MGRVSSLCRKACGTDSFLGRDGAALGATRDGGLAENSTRTSVASVARSFFCWTLVIDSTQGCHDARSPSCWPTTPLSSSDLAVLPISETPDVLGRSLRRRSLLLFA